jgi:hypothetical protein
MSDVQAQVGYKAVKKFYILHADISQSDRIFHSAANKQCTAMCAVAIASANILDPQYWNRSIITQIVLRGNEYYIVIIQE